MDIAWLTAAIIMRTAHILSAVTLLGAMLYVRVSPDADRLSTGYRPYIWWSAVLLVISGAYNLFAKSHIPIGYGLWFGVKALLAMHIIAVSFLLARSSLSTEKRKRLVTGVAISGAVVVGLSAYLRFLSNFMLP